MKSCVFLAAVASISVLITASCASSPRSYPLEEPNDDTAFLQSLLNEEAPVTVIPANSRPWITDPLIMTASSKTIVFEKGCIIRAKRGSFRDGGDILITLSGVRDVTLSGFGAILEMNRMDYRRKPYSKAEWRHGIALYECANVLIEGLTIRETGGDGVYIGQRRTQSVCTNITLRNLSLENNYRQGVSVISVRGLLMENCRVIGTSGTAPAAGIDFEPNSGVYGFTECVVRNCEFIDNSGAGILVYLKKMQPDDTPVDIIIDNCVSRKNALSFAIYSIPKGVRGRILIRGGDYSLLKWIRPSKEFTVSFEKP